jgi:hypothetical protein
MDAMTSYPVGAWTVTILLAGNEDTDATIDDVDAEIVDPGGRRWSATVMTTDVMAKIMQGRQPSWSSDGVWFACPDLLVIPRPGIEAILAAVAAMIDLYGEPCLPELLPDEDDDERVVPPACPNGRETRGNRGHQRSVPG